MATASLPHLTPSGQRSIWMERLKSWLADALVPSAREVYAGLDWEREARELADPGVEYPRYYLAPHHGLAEGYLSRWQAISWTFVEQVFRMRRVAPGLLDIVMERPAQRVVDLGCGTAAISLRLAQAAPEAQLTLLDLSPYQLAAARRQSQRAGIADRVEYRHAPAEHTGLASGSHDLALATLLFHELPQPVAQDVVAEAYRALEPGGRFIAFDAIQRAVPWQAGDRAVNALLARLLHEVYWREYMAQPLWQVCEAQGFRHVTRTLLFAAPWVYQVISATK